MDPFGVTCDPRLYVPRLASEAALAELRSAFAAGQRVCVLSGPTGLGKTLLLHVLAEQLTAARCVHLPYAALPPEELAHWTLAKLGEAPTNGGPYWDALAAAARREAERGRTLVLLLDDASALPAPTARALQQLVASLAGALGLVVVPVDDGRAGQVIAALGEGVLHVRLRHGLSPDELRRYVRERIARTGALHALTTFTSEHIDWLIAESAGNPRTLNVLATWLLHRTGFAPATFELQSSGDALWLETDAGDAPEPRAPRESVAEAALGPQTQPDDSSGAHPTDPDRPTRRRSSMLRRRARRAGRMY